MNSGTLALRIVISNGQARNKFIRAAGEDHLSQNDHHWCQSGTTNAVSQRHLWRAQRASASKLTQTVTKNMHSNTMISLSDVNVFWERPQFRTLPCRSTTCHVGQDRTSDVPTESKIGDLLMSQTNSDPRQPTWQK